MTDTDLQWFEVKIIQFIYCSDCVVNRMEHNSKNREALSRPGRREIGFGLAMQKVGAHDTPVLGISNSIEGVTKKVGGKSGSHCLRSLIIRTVVWMDWVSNAFSCSCQLPVVKSRFTLGREASSG